MIAEPQVSGTALGAGTVQGLTSCQMERGVGCMVAAIYGAPCLDEDAHDIRLASRCCPVQGACAILRHMLLPVS